MAMTQNNICKLCNEKSDLIKKSHIIPNFMYKGMFDLDHKIFLKDLINQNKKPQIRETGIFEKNILCKKCENLFSKNERYAAQFFKGPSHKSLSYEKRISKDGIKSIYVSGIDYKKLKLCILSILWRSHISQNTFFKNLNIEENAKEIERMLLANESISEDEYKLCIIGIQNQKNDLIRIIVNPTIKIIGNGKVAMYFINGYFYFINLKPKSSLNILNKVYLKESGEIEIPIFKGEKAQHLLTAFGLNSEFAKKYSSL